MIPSLLAALVLLSAAGCSRQAGLHGNAVEAAADSPSITEPGSVVGHPPAKDVASNFKDAGSSQSAQTLPEGTLLTVRLSEDLSAASSLNESLGDRISFEAFLDEPVVVAGLSVAPRGTAVSGRVESAQSSRVRVGRGYVRLALESMHLAGSDLPIQTSSLFVRGVTADRTTLHQASQSKSAQNVAPVDVVRLDKGRRLTFRLSEPVMVRVVAAPSPMATTRAKVDQ